MASLTSSWADTEAGFLKLAQQALSPNIQHGFRAGEYSYARPLMRSIISAAALQHYWRYLLLEWLPSKQVWLLTSVF